MSPIPRLIFRRVLGKHQRLCIAHRNGSRQLHQVFHKFPARNWTGAYNHNPRGDVAIGQTRLHFVRAA
ncbi:hypothetical protein AS149_37105 [Burkholderia cenocepacia]|nr:hypothetical protein AS149_37105 [Burkholderia cenocepacia]